MKERIRTKSEVAIKIDASLEFVKMKLCRSKNHQRLLSIIFPTDKELFSGYKEILMDNGFISKDGKTETSTLEERLEWYLVNNQLHKLCYAKDDLDFHPETYYHRGCDDRGEVLHVNPCNIPWDKSNGVLMSTIDLNVKTGTGQDGGSISNLTNRELLEHFGLDGCISMETYEGDVFVNLILGNGVRVVYPKDPTVPFFWFRDDHQNNLTNMFPILPNFVASPKDDGSEIFDHFYGKSTTFILAEIMRTIKEVYMGTLDLSIQFI